MDMTPAGVKCFIQIKTNTENRRGTRVKLSNALEYATAAAPVFIVLYTYEGSGRLKEVRLLHVWQKQIERILRRVREADANGQSALHKANLTFALAEIAPVAEADLLPAIEKLVLQIGHNYSDVKRAIVEKVGFDETAMKGTITFKEGTTIDQIIDNQIGLVESIEAERLIGRSVRFGIESRHPTIDTPAGQLIMRSHPIKCVVRLGSEKSSRQVSITSDMYVPSFPNLPLEKKRVRIVNSFVELIVHLENADIDFNAKTDDRTPYTLEELQNALGLINIFSTGQVRIEISRNNKPPITGTSDIKPFALSLELIEVDRFVEILSMLRAHDIPDDFRCQISELVAKADDVCRCNGIAARSKAELSGTFKFEGTSHLGPAHVLLYDYVECAGYVIYVIVRRKTDLVLDGVDQVKFTAGDVEYCNPIILKGTHATNRSFIEHEIEDRAKRSMGEPVMYFTAEFLREHNNDRDNPWNLHS